MPHGVFGVSSVWVYGPLELRGRLLVPRVWVLGGLMAIQLTVYDVETAPEVTFGDLRSMAAKHGWTEDRLLAYVSDDLDRPKETLERIFSSGPVTTVCPYTCLLRLYSFPHLAAIPRKGPRVCSCGCGRSIRSNQRWASPGCKKRSQRVKTG